MSDQVYPMNSHMQVATWMGGSVDWPPCPEQLRLHTAEMGSSGTWTLSARGPSQPKRAELLREPLVP